LESRRFLIHAAVHIVCLVGFAFLAVHSRANAKQPDRASDYVSIVPSDWTLLPEDTQTHERRFVSPSGDAWLSLYARPAGGTSIQAHMAAVRQREHEQITYERQGPTWIVVSGYIGDRIFYRKAMLACGGQSWHQLAFEYPTAKKVAFHKLVTRASYALQACSQVGCRPSK
jgi:hypothetical protein